MVMCNVIDVVYWQMFNVVDVVYLQMSNVVDVVEGSSLQAGQVVVVKTKNSEI